MINTWVNPTRTYASIDTGDRDKRSWCAATTIGYIDLSAANVELGTTIVASTMQSDLLVI